MLRCSQFCSYAFVKNLFHPSAKTNLEARIVKRQKACFYNASLYPVILVLGHSSHWQMKSFLFIRSADEASPHCVELLGLVFVPASLMDVSNAAAVGQVLVGCAVLRPAPQQGHAPLPCCFFPVKWDNKPSYTRPSARTCTLSITFSLP